MNHIQTPISTFRYIKCLQGGFINADKVFVKITPNVAPFLQLGGVVCPLAGLNLPVDRLVVKITHRPVRLAVD
jgi:hypothetical protein